MVPSTSSAADEYQHHLLSCHPRVKATSLPRLVYRHRPSCGHVASNSHPRHPPPSVLDCFTVNILRHSSGAPWWLAKQRKHVARLPNDRQFTTRTSAESLQQRVGLLRSMRTTSRRAKKSLLKKWSRSAIPSPPPRPSMIETDEPLVKLGSDSMNAPKASSKPPSQKISRPSYSRPWTAIREGEPVRA